MDTEFLQTLLDVVEGGSLAEAARRRNLTAAAVGQRLKALETVLGATLVSRSGATVRPTPACLRMVPRLQKILAEAGRLKGDIAEDGLAGPYRLGAISTALSDRVPALVGRLQTSAPEVGLKILPGSSAGLFAMLSRGELDAALLVEPAFPLPKSILAADLEDQPLAWIVPARPVTRNLPLIVYDRSSWGGAIAWNWIQRNIADADILCELDAPEMVAGLVAGGLGRAVLPVWGGLQRMAGIRIARIDTAPRRKLVFLHRGTPIDHACLAALTDGRA